MSPLPYKIIAILTLILGIGAIFLIKLSDPKSLSQDLFFIIPTLILGVVYLFFGFNKVEISKSSDRSLKIWFFYLISFVLLILNFAGLAGLSNDIRIVSVMLIGSVSSILFILALVFVLVGFQNRNLN